MEIPLLTTGEAKTYKALVELGESSVGNIIKISGVSHSKVYDILKRLSRKGLVSSINRNGKQYFSAADPQALQLLVKDERKKLDRQEKEIDSIVKQLKLRKKTTKAKSLLSSYEGIKGMKYVLDSILEEAKKGDEILILGTPRTINEQAGGYLKDWQKRRIKIGAICKIIADANALAWHLSWWKASKEKKLSFTKKSDSISPSYLVITDTSVVTIFFAGDVLSFKVEHRDIAQRYKTFFEEYWRKLK